MCQDKNICEICGYDGLIENKISETFEYKTHKITIDEYKIFECPDCGETIVEPHQLVETSKIIRDFQRQVDGLLTSTEIKKYRKALGFTQESFSKLLGVGAKSFARYESCMVTQSRAMDNLIRIVFEMPESLNVIQQKIKPKADSLEVSGKILYDYKPNRRKIQFPRVKVAGE